MHRTKVGFWTAASLAAALSSAAAETGGTFRDWTVDCSVGLTCNASTMPSGEPAIHWLQLSRGVAAEAPVKLRLSRASGEDGTLRGPVTFSTDDGRRLEVPAEAFTAVDGAYETSADIVGTRLLPAWRDARRLTIRLDEASGTSETTVSLVGLVAALRKIDDDQARVGTATALVDKGERPLPDRATLPTDIPDAAALPAAVRSVWENGGGDCADRGDDPVSDLGFSVPAGDAGRIYALACGMPGAYNYPSRLYLADGDQASPLPLPGMGDAGPNASMDVWNVDYADGQFRAFFKGRGIGDCGSYSVWRFDPSSADGLRLVEQRSKGECDGEMGEGPEGWPRDWPPR
ncbi:MAG: DUF1176 domain-containing protein [Methylobacterium sp.]